MADFEIPSPGEVFWFKDPTVAAGKHDRHPHLAVCLARSGAEVICVTISSNLDRLTDLDESADYETLDVGAHPFISRTCAASCRDAKSVPVALLKRMFDQFAEEGYKIRKGAQIDFAKLKSVVEKLLASAEVREALKKEIRHGLADILNAAKRT